MKQITSPSFTMLPQEWKDMGVGFLYYFVFPILLIYLNSVLSNVVSDGFTPDDFYINPVVQTSIVTLALTQIVSFLRKWIPENKIVIVK